MDIVFEDSKFEKMCNKHSELIRKNGPNRARKIRQRLDDLRAASTLFEMRSLGGRCHELRENRSGQLSLDLDHPFRLIFEPANNPIPKHADGGLDWKQITSVRIIGIEDTHE
ncbi:MAG: killer suppression protein [Anaerolineaceae bacterium]|nr:killer suppression protein [Anaerolineaceae bacterium]